MEIKISQQHVAMCAAHGRMGRSVYTFVALPRQSIETLIRDRCRIYMVNGIYCEWNRRTVIYRFHRDAGNNFVRPFIRSLLVGHTDDLFYRPM